MSFSAGKPSSMGEKITIHTLQAKKMRGEPIAFLTAYDYTSAVALDRSEIDGILVGDSLGMVVLGYENTLAVTMQDMIHHCRAVARGASRAHLVGDLPFMSYQASTGEAVRNAGSLLQKGGMNAVKLEGGRERVPAIKAIIGAGIPVMGHLGLTPQSVHQFGGWKMQGKSAESARRLIEDSLILEDAGCYSVVLESVPAELAQMITKRLSIPVIGIGAGAECDGQILVMHDMLGLFDRFTPCFVKKYTDLYPELEKAFRSYISDVRERRFPAAEHYNHMDSQAFRELVRQIEMLESDIESDDNIPTRFH
ncbi:MAG TPA: 3-methyl-2-oxobutanoate hydroxymethyltransferase [Acidobacteriota bacterium]|nr:3-methyl-2-oxobutanoate hydroxymethyltransferase [Acidobacteriota bacterium]